MARRLAFVAIFSLGFAAGASAGFVPLGPEQDAATGDIHSPALAAAGNGFLVAWRESDDDQILAQRTDLRGARVGAPIEVHPTPFFSTGPPGLASAADGSFVIAWTRSGSPPVVDARAFDATGAALGPIFAVGGPAIDRGRVVVARSSAGGFLVAFVGPATVPAGPDTAILTRGFLAGADPAGELFRVNATEGGRHELPSVAISSLGRALYVWRHEVDLESPVTLRARVLDSDGGWLDGDQLLATDPGASGTQSAPAPSIAPTPDGGFLVVWGYYDPEEGRGTIFARRLGTAGEPIGPLLDFTSPSFDGYACDPQLGPFCEMRSPAATFTRDGDAALGWIATVQILSRGVILPVETHVELLSLGVDGQPAGPPARIEERTLFHAASLGLATAAHDPVLATWNAFSEVRAISLARPVFDDDFESGDTGAWAP